MDDKRGLRTRLTNRNEAGQLVVDRALLTELEQLGRTDPLFVWEREILELATRRVYCQGRALMAKARGELNEIVARRGGRQVED